MTLTTGLKFNSNRFGLSDESLLLAERPDLVEGKLKIDAILQSSIAEMETAMDIHEASKSIKNGEIMNWNGYLIYKDPNGRPVVATLYINQLEKTLISLVRQNSGLKADIAKLENLTLWAVFRIKLNLAIADTQLRFHKTFEKFWSQK